MKGLVFIRAHLVVFGSKRKNVQVGDALSVTSIATFGKQKGRMTRDSLAK